MDFKLFFQRMDSENLSYHQKYHLTEEIAVENENLTENPAAS